MGRTKERRQRCQRLDGYGHRGKKTPTQVDTSREARSTLSSCPVTPSAEAVSDVVKTSGPPIMSRRALISAGRPRGESRGSGSGTHEVRVHVSFVWVAEVGWTHRASSALGGRKASW
jgi:hypothetical protein